MDVGGGFDQAVKVVVAAKEFVSSAVSSEPHAALAWAGVCIFLPVFSKADRYVVIMSNIVYLASFKPVRAEFGCA